MTQTLPVTNQKLLQQAILISSNKNIPSYPKEAWQNFRKSMAKTNLIYLSRDDKKLSQTLPEYLAIFFQNVCQQIFTSLDNKFSELHAIDVFTSCRDEDDFKITNYHQKNMISINIPILVFRNYDYDNENSYYHFVIFEYLEEQFNQFFNEKELKIEFHPTWLLVANDDNQYQLMLDEKSLAEQLSLLKVKMLEQAQQFIKQLLLAKKNINKVNQQIKHILMLAHHLTYAINIEYDFINNLCNYAYYYHDQTYINQMLPTIKQLHQVVKDYDTALIDYVNSLMFSDETIQNIEQKYIDKVSYLSTIDTDLYFGILFSDMNLQTKINNVKNMKENKIIYDDKKDYHFETSIPFTNTIFDIIRQLVSNELD